MYSHLANIQPILTEAEFRAEMLRQCKERKNPSTIEAERLTIDCSRFPLETTLFKYLEVPLEAPAPAAELPKLDKKAIKEAKIREMQAAKNLEFENSPITPQKVAFERPIGKYGIYIGEEETYGLSSDSENDKGSDTSDDDDDQTFGVRDRMRRSVAFTPTVTTNFEEQLSKAKVKKQKKKKSDQLLLTASDKYYEAFEETRRNKTRKIYDYTIKSFKSVLSTREYPREQIERQALLEVDDLSKKDMEKINTLITNHDLQTNREKVARLKAVQEVLTRQKQKDDNERRRREEEERARETAAREEQERLVAQAKQLEERKQAEKKQQEEAQERQRREREAANRPVAPEPTRPQQATASVPTAVNTNDAITIPQGYLTSVPAYVDAHRRMATLDTVKSQIAQQCTDVTLKRNLSRAMNKFSGRVNNTLVAMDRLIMEILQFLTQTQQQTPAYLDCAFVTLAEKIISQIENTGSRDNYKILFPNAILVVEVSSQFPKFMDLIIGMIHKKAKFTVPLFAIQAQGESKAAYLQRLGYALTDETTSTLESDNDFEDRMKGLVGFYAAITQTNDLGNQVKNPYGPANAWRWIAGVLNMQQTIPIAVEMLSLFLSISAYKLHEVYNKQFMKIMQYIQQQFLPRIARQQGMTRSNALLEQILRRYTNYTRTGRDSTDDPLKNPARDLDVQSVGNFGKDL